MSNEDRRTAAVEDGLSHCWQNNGWHVYGAGPCFDDRETAVRYRTWLDSNGLSWASEEDRFRLGWFRLVPSPDAQETRP